jgi:hypothetical protein
MVSLEYDLSPIGAIINDLQVRICFNFIEASVVFAPHSCNKPAHELAVLV